MGPHGMGDVIELPHYTFLSLSLLIENRHLCERKMGIIVDDIG